MTDSFSAMLCCAPSIGRGLKDDLLYAMRLDATLQAFQPGRRQDRLDGEDRRVEERRHHDSAPLIVGDHVIVGVSGGEYGVRGYLKSFNAKTGKLEWTTYTIPAPGEPAARLGRRTTAGRGAAGRLG